MGVIINKPGVIILTGKMIRDALLALSDEDRIIVVSKPDTDEDKVISLARDKTTGRVAIKYNNK